AFTTTNWNVYQTVTVSTVHDQDTVNDSANITLTAGSNYGGATGLVKITITDNDSENLNLPSGTVTVAEGGNATFDVSLSTQPSGGVTVSLSLPSGTDLKLDKTALTFTVGNWSTAQPVKVTAAQDHDASDDSATISVSAIGGGYSGRTGRVNISVTDDDTPALSLTSSSLSVTEGGSVTFDVKLATLPSANVNVTLTAGRNPDVSVDKTTLAFTPANWNTAQRVTVSAAEDDDLDNDGESIVLSASGGDYVSVEESVNVTVTDNDNAGLTVSPTTLDLTEGRQGTFTVRLTKRPSDDVSVTLTLPSGSDVSADKASLTFTDDDWDKTQTVTVRVAQDDDAVDDGTSVISLASSGGGYDNLSESVSVDVTDDDEESLVLPPNALKIAEGGSGRFAVSLATLPSGTVSVTLTQPSNPDVRVDADPDANGEQTVLTFTSSNWNTPQLVAVLVGDDDDSSNESASITLSATGGGYAGKTGSVGVEVEDDDSDALVITPNPLNFAEGESGTFTVRLATLPSADVTVAVQPSDNADISLDKTSLTFTQANWKEEQTVTATSIQDDDIESDEATVDLSASGGGYDGVGSAQRIVVTDDDAAGLTVSPGSLRIDEGGSALFTMRLVRQPSGDVIVNLDAQNNPDVTLDKTTLTFTSGAWNTSQTVRVSANHDADDSDERLVILYTASGSGYDSVSGDVSVEIVDDDESSTTLPANTQGMITVSLEAIQIDEGTQGSLDVGLDGIAQASDVTVFLTNINPDITLSPSTLTFTPSNWNEDQRISIKVSGDADGIDDSDTITLAATGIDVPSRQVSVSVRDDEESSAAGERGTIVVNPGTLVIGEGSSKTFTARLVGNAPLGNVNVLLGKTNDDIAISPQSLTFDSSNWESDQVITVTLAQDDDEVDDADTITLSAIGGGYDRARRSLAVVGIDNPGTIEVSTDRIGLVGGGDPVSFVVRLGMRPTGTQVVIVSLSSSNPGIEITPPSLIFTADNWDTGQSAGAKAAADSDRQGGLDIITLAATGGNYSSASRTISVSYTEGGSQPPATLSDPVKTQALAMPSAVSGDQSTLFVHCKQDTPCTVYLDCSAQSDGSALQGAIPGEIPARGIRMLTAQDIETHVGDSWSGKGRLGCALRSAHRIDSQVWTRSGDGVLVNNSAYLSSYLEGQRYRADIESITSPDGFEKSNIRIRCTASGAMSCTSTRFTCYEDDGTRYESDTFEIGASVVRHVQSEELAGMINHRWQGMGMTCELRSDAPFTVQILTRTGGGGALVNNSAGGEVRIGSGG
uniref:beta strand repeat-containing protein n=1 Tax=Thioalkalivibrio sp. HK1 TaxID=1469245 RepID=UPI00046FA6B8